MAAVNYDSNPIINSTSETTYNYSGGEIETSKLKIKVRGTQSRYDMNNMITIRVQFWNRGDYNTETKDYEWTEGQYQNISIIPYASGSEVNYKTEEIDLSGQYIKSIQIIGNATELEIYKESISLTSDNYNDYPVSNFIIPILDELPDASSVPNGYVCILRSMI